jgi:hypothetical protein
MKKKTQNQEPRCRICNCAQNNCGGCVERTGASCSWEVVREEYPHLSLCSACTDLDGLALIITERVRVVEEEGFDQVHDDQHNAGHLLMAAQAYVWAAQCQSIGVTDLSAPPHYWPFGPKDWKPSPDPIRNLVIAGQFLAAEIDRQQRAKLRAAGRFHE